MPVAVAMLIRVLIQAVTQVGVLIIADKLLGFLVDYAKSQVAKFYNMTDDEAQDTIANEVIDALALVGVIGLTIKTKLPTVVAEKLGFTSKGYLKRAVSTKIPKADVGTGAKSAVVVETKAEVKEKITRHVHEYLKTPLDKAQQWATIVIGAVGAPVGIGLLITNTVDFGAWNSSAYQTKFQKLLAIFGLEPDKDSRNPRTTSQDTFNQIYNALRDEGAITINDPYKQETVPFSRDNLLDVTDRLASHWVIETGGVTKKQLLGSVLPLIQFKTSTPVVTTTSTQTKTPTATPVVTTKVFTGIVSQGVLGNGLTFTARTNDMIDDVAELLESASNNLAPFLVALPGRITYELKIVSSYTTKDGFTQRGQAFRVISGYNTNGTPKYKTITNKFAVLYLYILTDKGTRTKIGQVVIGSVNSANFQISTTNLADVEKALQQVVTTQNTEDIKVVASTTQVFTQQPTPTAPKVVEPSTPIVPQSTTPATTTSQPVLSTQYHFIIGQYGSSEVWTDAVFRANPTRGREVSFAEWNANPQKSVNLQDANIAQFVREAETKTTPTQTTNQSTPASARPGATASTLAEWYTANNQTLPTVQQRSVLYEQYGLGVASLYVGSAEQNTRLLQKLKGL